MTVQEAAREIGLSVDIVYDLCRKGLLPHRRLGPKRGRIWIGPEHIAAYLASCEVTPETAPAARAAPAPKAAPPARAGRMDGKPNRWLK
jgi:excisionase family DNA binding protein